MKKSTKKAPAVGDPRVTVRKHEHSNARLIAVDGVTIGYVSREFHGAWRGTWTAWRASKNPARPGKNPNRGHATRRDAVNFLLSEAYGRPDMTTK